MSVILAKENINERLKEYYVEVYGENDTDVWYEQPAVNVWVFQRDGKIISLNCHILSGKVTELVEEANNSTKQ